MTQFDILLRQRLMEANLERSELLAVPQDWEKRRTRPASRWRRIPRGVAVEIVVLRLITVAAAAAVSLWVSCFGWLNQRQQEVIGDMEVSGERTEQPEKTAAKSLLPPPVMSFKSFPYT